MKKCGKECQLHFRVTAEQKKQFKDLSEKRGLSITDLVLNLLNNKPLKDYTCERELFNYLNNLTRQLQFLGNNINQVAIAMHQIKNEHRFPGDELQTFNVLMKEYIESREGLSKQLSSIFFR